MTFKLPRSIASFLNVNPDFVYESGVTTVNIQGIKRRQENHHLLCLLDIVEPTYYASQMLPILRVIPITDNIKTLVCSEFSSLFYVPAREVVVRNLRIRFKSSNSDIIPIDKKRLSQQLFISEIENEKSTL